MSNFRYFLIFLGLMALMVPAAQAQELYTVSDILIDKTDVNAVAARKAAITEAQRAAFLRLAGYPKDGVEPPALPGDGEIAILVRDFSIRNEQLSANRYAAQFTVRFTSAAADFIRRWSGDEISADVSAASAAPLAVPVTDVVAPVPLPVDGAMPVDLVVEQAVTEKLSLPAVIRITGFAEWMDAQNRLQSVSPSVKIALSSLSRDEARFTLSADWPGGVLAFTEALAEKGLSLVSVDGVYLVTLR